MGAALQEALGLASWSSEISPGELFSPEASGWSGVEQASCNSSDSFLVPRALVLVSSSGHRWGL